MRGGSGFGMGAARSTAVTMVACAAAIGAMVLPSNASTVSASSRTDASPGEMYVNPVSDPGAENFGSPSVIRGRDGYWYAFGPGNPLRAGEPRPLFPIMRSDDLTSWTHVGDVFTEDTFPTWGALSGGLWAPAIEYADGEYRLYFTLQNLPGLPRPNTAIGVATAPTPTGPWVDSGRPLVEPALWSPPTEEPRYRTTIDAEVITAADGRRYLYYGGFGGGVWVRELAADGMSTVGGERQLATDSTYEGPYVIRRDGWYYLLLSTAHCCKGPVTGYSVFVGRSRSPMGPFTDRHGVRLDAPSPGGTPVVTPNGNRWVGTGHNAVIPDLAGQDWMTVNGIDRDNPYLSGDRGAVRRPLLLDRMDWIDGWPTVRAGAGVSEGPVAAPDVRGHVADAFEGPTLDGTRWRGAGWSLATEAAGSFVRAVEGADALVSSSPVRGDVRVRAAVRTHAPEGTVGLELGRRGAVPPVLAVRLEGRQLVVETGQAGAQAGAQAGGRVGGRVAKRVALPATFDPTAWHDLSVEVRGEDVVVRVGDAGLFDPVAEVEVATSTRPVGPFALTGDGSDVDDVTVATLARPVTEAEAVPTTEELVDAEEFDAGVSPGSDWVRGPAGTVEDGVLALPVEDTDLTGAGNSAAILLRDVPDDEPWVAETRMTLDFGAGPWRAFPQAGLIAYGDDDSYLRLTARGNRAVTDSLFQKEMRFAGSTVAADVRTGPVAETMWLRLAHTVDAENGEHEVRAGTSTDGERWTWGATHVLPAGTDLRIGLTAHGAADADAGALTARFDYLRVHRLGWTAP